MVKGELSTPSQKMGLKVLVQFGIISNGTISLLNICPSLVERQGMPIQQLGHPCGSMVLLFSNLFNPPILTGELGPTKQKEDTFFQLQTRNLKIASKRARRL